MAKRIVILGGGTGGRSAPTGCGVSVPATTSRSWSSIRTTITLPAGIALRAVRVDAQHRDRPFSAAPTPQGNRVRLVPVERVDIQSDIVHLGDGTELSYDALVVASGSVLVEEETEGLTGAWVDGEGLHLLRRRGAAALHDALEGFDGGRLVVNVVDMPIKCRLPPWNSVFLPTGSSSGSAFAIGWN